MSNLKQVGFNTVASTGSGESQSGFGLANMLRIADIGIKAKMAHNKVEEQKSEEQDSLELLNAKVDLRQKLTKTDSDDEKKKIINEYKDYTPIYKKNKLSFEAHKVDSLSPIQNRLFAQAKEDSVTALSQFTLEELTDVKLMNNSLNSNFTDKEKTKHISNAYLNAFKAKLGSGELDGKTTKAIKEMYSSQFGGLSGKDIDIVNGLIDNVNDATTTTKMIDYKNDYTENMNGKDYVNNYKSQQKFITDKLNGLNDNKTKTDLQVKQITYLIGQQNIIKLKVQEKKDVDTSISYFKDDSKKDTILANANDATKKKILNIELALCSGNKDCNHKDLAARAMALGDSNIIKEIAKNQYTHETREAKNENSKKKFKLTKKLSDAKTDKDRLTILNDNIKTIGEDKNTDDLQTYSWLLSQKKSITGSARYVDAKSNELVGNMTKELTRKSFVEFKEYVNSVSDDSSLKKGLLVKLNTWKSALASQTNRTKKVNDELLKQDTKDKNNTVLNTFYDGLNISNSDKRIKYLEEVRNKLKDTDKNKIKYSKIINSKKKILEANNSSKIKEMNKLLEPKTIMQKQQAIVARLLNDEKTYQEGIQSMVNFQNEHEYDTRIKNKSIENFEKIFNSGGANAQVSYDIIKAFANSGGRVSRKTYAKIEEHSFYPEGISIADIEQVEADQKNWIKDNEKEYEIIGLQAKEYIMNKGSESFWLYDGEAQSLDRTIYSANQKKIIDMAKKDYVIQEVSNTNSHSLEYFIEKEQESIIRKHNGTIYDLSSVENHKQILEKKFYNDKVNFQEKLSQKYIDILNLKGNDNIALGDGDVIYFRESKDGYQTIKVTEDGVVSNIGGTDKQEYNKFIKDFMNNYKPSRFDKVTNFIQKNTGKYIVNTMNTYERAIPLYGDFARGTRSVAKITTNAVKGASKKAGRLFTQVGSGAGKVYNNIGSWIDEAVSEDN